MSEFTRIVYNSKKFSHGDLFRKLFFYPRQVMVKDGDQNLQSYSEFLPKKIDFVQDHIGLKLLSIYNSINLN